VKPRRPSRAAWTWAGGVGLALLIVVAALAVAVRASWGFGGQTGIGLHGWLALGVALVGTTVVGGGLMWLAFYSARSGWDDIDREP
jgi:hypothetical protein